MHLTPAARNFLQQQAKFDDFIDCYSNQSGRIHHFRSCGVPLDSSALIKSGLPTDKQDQIL
jgi:hypothetical protein